MNNYFIWFKISGDQDPEVKSKASTHIHNIMFNDGIKLTTKSNAFFYKSNNNANEIADHIQKIAGEDIKLVVIKIDQTEYQGWLNKDEWDFLNDEKNLN